MGKLRTTMATIAVAAIGWASAVPGLAQAKKEWKDRAEFDLYNSVTNETDPARRLVLLNSWTGQYPDTQFNVERLILYLRTYKELSQAQKVVDTASQVLAMEPANFTALYWLTFLTPSLYAREATLAQLEAGERASRSFLEQLDVVFAANKKPAKADADQWKRTRTDLASTGHRTLGWISKQRRNYDQAEKEYRAALALNPECAAASLELGQTIFDGKRAQRQPEVLFHYARAISIQGSTGLDPSVKAAYDSYLDEAYVKYHGGRDGLDELRREARSAPMPPAGFRIENVADLERARIAAEEAADRANPMLALWKNIKTALIAPDGAVYFEDKMKGAGLPAGVYGVEKFTGKLVSMTPAARPKELVLAIEDSSGTNGDAKLRLQGVLPGSMEPGTKLSFDGVAQSFVKDPFMVTFFVEKGHVAGWESRNEPGPGPNGGARKGATKKQ